MKDYNYYKNKQRKGRQLYDVHSIDKVINNIIEVTNSDLTLEQIKGHKRNRRLTELRFPVYWICCYVYDMPVTFIGKNMDKDHSTIIHGKQRMEDWYDTDREFKAKFDIILKKFENYHNR